MRIGYEIDQGNRGMRVIGAMPQDETYTGTGTGTGTVNVSAMWQHIWSRRADAQLRTIVIHDGLLQALQRKDLDRKLIANMTRERADVPLLMIDTGNGTHALVDGNNRLAKRHEMGLDDVQIWEFPKAALRTYRVEIFMRVNAGPWLLQNEEQILARTFGTFAEVGADGSLKVRDERRQACA